jgi:hypothetical protein
MPVPMAEMNWVMWVVPAVLGLIGLWLVIGGLRRLFTGKVIGGGLGATSGVALLAAGAAAGLLGLNVLTYTRLTAEQPMGTVGFRLADGADPTAFVATLTTPDGKKADYPIQGDRWRIDARVVKWKPWANIIGFDAQGRLERISGDWDDVAQVNARTGSAHNLFESPMGLDMMSIIQGAKVLPVFDAYYGNSVYAPMQPGLEFKVTLSQNGLVLRPANAAAEQAMMNWKAPTQSGPQP